MTDPGRIDRWTRLQRLLVPVGWRPLFFDYLYVGVTNAVAFSPTDAMPMAAWAKPRWQCSR